jgi:hypothetical protein
MIIKFEEARRKSKQESLIKLNRAYTNHHHVWKTAAIIDNHEAHFLRNISFVSIPRATTMLNSPFVTPYDDDSRYFHMSQSYRQMMRQKAYDEELRWRRAREVEYRRQLAAKAMQRRAYEEELARRRKVKEEKALQEQNLAEKGRQNMASRRHHSEPSYQVVRGLDGRLYRVPIEMEPKVPTIQQDPSATAAEAKLPHRIVRGRDGCLNRVATPAVTNNKSSPEDIIPTASVLEVSTNVSERPLQMKENEDHAPKLMSKESKTPRRRRATVLATVLVEDASDSEDEDQELNSVWRNRRPSPGEWMEPVESM